MYSLVRKLQKFIVKMFPIFTWIQTYSITKLKGDLIAGVTVGIISVPQAMSYAALAGLPVEYGFYSAMIPGIVYAFFGTSKDANIGGALTITMLVNRYNTTLHPDGAVMLLFFVSVALIVMRLTRLTFIANFVPIPVLNGFVSGVVIVSIVSQFKSLLGINNTPSGTLQRIWFLGHNIQHTNPHDLILGLIFLTLLLLLLLLPHKLNNFKCNGALKFIFVKVCEGICIAKSVIACILATVVIYLLTQHSSNYKFTLTGEVPAGFPHAKFPVRDIIISKNETLTVLGFVQDVGIGFIIIPVITSMQTLTIGKAFARMNNYKIDSAQEILAVGVAGIVGSCFGCFSTVASFSRSAVNAKSGSQSPLSNLFSCLVVMVAVTSLTAVLKLIPLSVLAAIIIASCIPLFDINTPRHIWNVNRINMLPYVASICGTIYQLEIGILLGSGVSLIILIYNTIRPSNVFHSNSMSNSVQLKGVLSYASSEYIKDTIDSRLCDQKVCEYIEVNMSSVLSIDYDILMLFRQLSLELCYLDVQLKFTDVIDDKVKDMLLGEDLLQDKKLLNENVVLDEKEANKHFDEIYYTTEIFESNV